MLETLLSPAVFPLLAALVGLILGSFYNVCVHRYISEESIVFPPSKCPKCGHRLSALENIPLLSYLVLMGRCRHCKAPISLRYPIVEGLSGLWALALALQFGPTPEWLLFMVLGALLLIASFIDFELYILPDILTYPAGALAVLGALFIQFRPWQEVAISALAGTLIFLALQRFYRWYKGVEGLGTGDIKLMVCLGTMVSWPLLPLAITLGAVSALLASAYYALRSGEGLKTMVPFGPFLCLGAMLTLLYGEQIMRFVGR